ncbi:MAG: hypothetical protein H6644_09570 [Caldilineaceae bacterium]|nr:hypothetical protein [Caldilineaceae bacterium]
MSNRICVTPVEDDDVEGTPNAVCADQKADTYGTGATVSQVCGDYASHVDHTISSGDANNGPAPVGGNGSGPDNNRTVDVLIRDDDAAGLIFTPAVAGRRGRRHSATASNWPPPCAECQRDRWFRVQAAGADATALTFTRST